MFAGKASFIGAETPAKKVFLLLKLLNLLEHFSLFTGT